MNYFYPRKRNILQIEDITNSCRFFSGIYLLTGTSGCGKTTFLSQLSMNLSNNDFVIDVKATSSSDILKILSIALGVRNYHNIDDIFSGLHNIYSHGQNIIIIIDDAHLLSKEQLISLNSLLDVAGYLRIVLCGNLSLKKVLSQRAVSPILGKIQKRYRIKYLSYLDGVRYISFICGRALALSQYAKPITFPAILLLSFVSNRNIHYINFVTTQSLKQAYSEKTPRVTFHQVFNIAISNFDMVRTNIYLKFQKIFAGILILLTLFFGTKILFDRYDTITTLEARQSVARQEAEFQLK